MDFSHVWQIPRTADWLNLGILFLVIFLVILSAELVRKKLAWPQEATRKSVHIVVGLLILFAPALLQASLPLLSISLFFTIFNLIAVRRNLLPGIHIDPRNLGTVYYPLSLFILILLFWSNHKPVIIAAMMIMAVGDAVAAIVGQNIRNPHRYVLIRDRKSLEGTLAMLLTGFVVVMVTFSIYNSDSHLFWINAWIAALTAVVAVVAEALGDAGNDNFSVPVLSGVLLYLLQNASTEIRIQFTVGLLLAGLAALASRRARFLTGSGAAVTFLLAVFVFGFGGWGWTVPILTFFILSSLLSKSGQIMKQKFDLVFEKGSERDHAQVLANGSVAGCLVVLQEILPGMDFYPIYLGAIAAAMGDTWATEIGVVFGKIPRMIYNLNPVPPGTSGGVTLAGIGGSLAGTLLVGGSGLLFTHSNQVALLTIVAIAGVVGSLSDSLIGALFQAQYRCPNCRKITEKKIHCDQYKTQRVSGLSWVNNDLVNFLNTITGAIAAGLLSQIWL